MRFQHPLVRLSISSSQTSHVETSPHQVSVYHTGDRLDPLFYSISSPILPDNQYV